VAAVHRQTRLGLSVSVLFVVAAPLSALVFPDAGLWLPVHLFAIGGLLTAISTTTQMLSVTWSASPAPTRRSATLQVSGLALGSVAVVTGHEAEVDWLLGIGGALVLVALVGLGLLLREIMARAALDRFRPAVVAYQLAICCGLVGVGLGVALGLGVVDPPEQFDVRQAHLVLNLFGLVGLVIAGTLPYFVPTQLRMKMAPRASARYVTSAVAAMAGAVLAAAVSWSTGHRWASATSMTAYGLALLTVVAALPRPGRRQLAWAGPRAVQLALGLIWWLAGVGAAAVDAARGTGLSSVALRAVIVGGYAQVLVASLAYLGPVLRGGGHQRLTAGFGLTRSWTSLAWANLAAVLAVAGWDRPAAVVLVIWAFEIATRAILLLRDDRTPAAPPPP